MAIIGITIGVLILILVTSVMNGFQKELKERILETIPHASIIGNIQIQDYESIERIVYDNSEVIGVAPYIETQGLLSSGSFLKGVYIYGVIPKYENTVSTISDHIVSGSLKTLEEDKYYLVFAQQKYSQVLMLENFQHQKNLHSLSVLQSNLSFFRTQYLCF